MIKLHEHLDIYGKPTFVRAIVKGPFNIIAAMEQEACFYYVKQGVTSVYTPTEKLTTSANEGLLLQCGTYINEYKGLAHEEECEAIGVHLYPEVLQMIYDKDFPKFAVDVENVKPIKYEKYKADALLKSFIEGLDFYFNNPELVSDEILKLKIKELMLILAKTDNLAQVKVLITGLFDKSIVDFKSIISANIFNPLNMEELAALCNLSLSSFKRTFKKHFQLPPAKYIKQKRLDNAKQLLLATSLRITDVAYDSGFADLAHFSKSFQTAFGCSPSDFKLNQKNKSLN